MSQVNALLNSSVEGVPWVKQTPLCWKVVTKQSNHELQELHKGPTNHTHLWVFNFRFPALVVRPWRVESLLLDWKLGYELRAKAAMYVLNKEYFMDK